MSQTEELDLDDASFGRSIRTAGQFARDRILSFGIVYGAIFAFLVLYIFTVRGVEYALDQHFQALADEAINIKQLDRPIALQIQTRMRDAIERSPWVRFGGVKATSLVLASDGVTWIYVQGRIVPQPEGLQPTDVLRQAVDLLPATADVNVSVPHNSLVANAILLTYAGLLLWGLYGYNRANQRRHEQQLEIALRGRDAAAERARRIESELEETRQRLTEVEPAEAAFGEEIATLQAERRELQQKLARLATREEELRGKAERAFDLAQEVQALEDLLEEAAGDLAAKDDEIGELSRTLKKAARPGGGGRARTRAADSVARRLRTLYKTLEIDDRAIDDIVALRNEANQLKAEEQLKRLAEEADNVAVRRKVGGLPEHLTIFELGFAGKGRIYYTRGRHRRFRILAVGAKNSQDSDLEYLRRLGKDEMA
jgi:hypothetical protein